MICYIYQLTELFSFVVAQCTDGTLDIINQVNSDVKDNGQLFICSNDTWFPLCSTMFDSYAAQAACRQLGFVDGSMLHNIIITKSDMTTNIYLLMVCQSTIIN